MTQTTKRRGLIAALVGLALLAGLWFSASALLRAYIHHRFAGVRVGRVTLAWEGVTLRDVRVERDGVRADIPEVFVSRGKAVTIRGGTVDVDVDALTKGGGSSSGTRPRITGSLDAVTVKKGGTSAHTTNVRIDDKLACFDEGRVDHVIGSLAVDGGCVALDRSSVTFRKLRLVPSVLGKWIGPSEAIEALDGSVALDASKASLGSVSYGTAYTLSKIDARRTGGRVSVTIVSARVDNPIVYPTPITLKQLTTDIDVPTDVPLDIAALRTVIAAVETNLTAWVGAAAFHASPKVLSIVGDETCQTWVDAMPAEMRVGPLSNASFDGRLSFALRVRPTPTVDIVSTCRASCAAFASLRSTFEYTAYDSKGQPFTRRTGPKTKDWVPLAAMNPAIPQAVMTLEDPAFRSHKGFLVGAIENSLKANLAADKFVRGGSTITMQLVKNLWLRRDKALARKAQEILLSSAIESCMTKDEIIELYLNVVEFGPDIYGIGAATRRYFSENPGVIQPVQAFFLASILPAPRKATIPTTASLARIEKLMRKLADNGALPDGIDVPDEGSSVVDTGPIDTTGWKVNQ